VAWRNSFLVISIWGSKSLLHLNVHTFSNVWEVLCDNFIE
jgi:hypothetical protein